MREIQFREALREAMQEEMRKDDRVFLLGEEVAEYNGAYKVSQGMLDEFGVGLLMAKLYFENNEIFKTNITQNFFISLGLSAILYLFFKYSNFSLYQNFYCHIFFRSLLSIFLFFFIFSLNGLFLKIHENGFLSKLFNPFIFLGKISYGLYLWHLPIILSLTKINSFSSLSIFFLTMGLTVLVSTISYFYFELPIINKYRS